MGKPKKEAEMKLAYLKDFWESYQIKAGLFINPEQNPSILYAGESGSGKSTALKFNILELLRTSSVDLWFMNYKDSKDFRFLKSYPQYFCGEDCGRGFEAFYDCYGKIRRFEGEDRNHMTIMVFDEYPAFLLNTQMKDKKLAERYMRNFGEIIMSGRSYKVGCWIVNQRPDASYYMNGSREQFHVRILLTRGIPSKESLTMMGFTREDFRSEKYRVGEGVAFVDGLGMYEIKYPVCNHEKLEREIMERLSCGRNREAEG